MTTHGVHRSFCGRHRRRQRTCVNRNTVTEITTELSRASVIVTSRNRFFFLPFYFLSRILYLHAYVLLPFSVFFFSVLTLPCSVRSAMSVAAVSFIVAVVVSGASGKHTAVSACSLSEFACSASADAAAEAVVRCVPAVKYCDGRRDCPDGSDEPQYCTCEFY